MEYTKKYIINFIAALLVIFCLFLIIHGQKVADYMHVAEQLLGLAGIIAMLGIYNNKQK